MKLKQVYYESILLLEIWAPKHKFAIWIATDVQNSKNQVELRLSDGKN